MLVEWQDDAVDGLTRWEVPGPFTRAMEPRICHALAWELSCALLSADVRSGSGVLPGLEVLAPELEHAGHAFTSFIDARQVVGRQVLLLSVLR